MKNKRTITLVIIFTLLFAFGLGSFANDFGGDGTTLGVPLYPYIPIHTAQLDIVDGGNGTDALDNFVVNLGGFSSLGSLSNMEYIGSYANSSYRYNVSVNREENSNFYSFTETIKPLGDLMNGHTGTRVFLETGTFSAHKYQGYWNGGVKPYVEALGTVANNATIQAVTYDYVARVWQLTSNIQTGSEVTTAFAYNVVNGTYIQGALSYSSNSTTLFPDAFFESITAKSTLDQLENIGNSDKIEMATYTEQYIEILQCRVMFRIRWGSNIATSTKSIAIHNYYTTLENMQADVWRYGPSFIIDGNVGDTTIVNPPSVESPPLDFSAFSEFISDTVGGFMNTAIFGSITFGVIVYTVLGLGLLMWILKMWGGG